MCEQGDNVASPVILHAWKCIDKYQYFPSTQVAIYVNKQITNNHKIFMDPFLIPNTNILTVDIVCNKSECKASFICVYNPPWTNNSAIKALYLNLESIPNVTIIQGNFNLHSNNWNPTIIDTPDIADDLLNVITLSGLSLINTDGMPTWHHPSGKSSVIDLLFCHNSLLSHYHSCFLNDKEGQGSSNHSIFFFNFQKRTDYYSDEYIKQDSEAESDFSQKITTCIIKESDNDNVEEAFQHIYLESHSAWLQHTSRAKLGSNPTHWWDNDYQDAKDAYEEFRSNDNKKLYHKAIQTARSAYFQCRIHNMSTLLWPWEGVWWTKPCPPSCLLHYQKRWKTHRLYWQAFQCNALTIQQHRSSPRCNWLGLHQ